MSIDPKTNVFSVPYTDISNVTSPVPPVLPTAIHAISRVGKASALAADEENAFLAHVAQSGNVSAIIALHKLLPDMINH